MEGRREGMMRKGRTCVVGIGSISRPRGWLKEPNQPPPPTHPSRALLRSTFPLPTTFFSSCRRPTHFERRRSWPNCRHARRPKQRASTWARARTKVRRAASHSVRQRTCRFAAPSFPPALPEASAKENFRTEFSS